MPPVGDEIWSEEEGAVVLLAVKCDACGVVLFPPQGFGCVACGAAPARLQPIAVPAIGRLHSFAVVNRHPSHPTPYTIAEVELDAGPLVRGLVEDGVDLRPGLRLAGKVTDVDGGRQCVFGPNGGGAR